MKPNIILLTTHDLGAHVRCYGGDDSIPTPNLDRLAAEGVRFENHFCTEPYCSPSRGSIITGKYPHVNGLMGLVNLGWSIPVSNEFLPEILNRAGYETALFGHQHVAENPECLGYGYISDRRRQGCRDVSPMVVDYLKQISRDSSRPFFIEAGFTEVHRPFGNLEEIPVREEDITPFPFLRDTPGLRSDMAMFYEQIRRMDRSVGEILDALHDLALEGNTLVVFTTDHDVAFPRAKATLYDPGIRTALLMRWPEELPVGRSLTPLVSNVDLFATLVDIAGEKMSDDCNGRSFVELLRGGEYEEREFVFAGQNTFPKDIKRCVRTARYKYIRNYDEGPLLALPTDVNASLTRRDMNDDHLAPRPESELYDLADDPLEQVNLAGNTEYAEIEKDMAARLQQLLEETGDPILGGKIARPGRETDILENLWDPGQVKQRADDNAELFAEYLRLRQEQDS